MPLRPEEVSELSRLLDEVLELDPAGREAWLDELERSRPEAAQRLRGMLQQAGSNDTALLPKLPAADPDDAVALAGERVGPYVLVREIGRGGMGSVWLADRADGAFKRRLALKLPRLTWSTGLSKRMARERDIGALLEHSNIARLYDAGVDEHGRPYIAMEYIDGQPIDLYCRERALDVQVKLRLFLQVAHAVAYAHGRLVLHRDLKPSNVLVDANGQAHLLDFGIAKLLDETGGGADLTQEQGRVLTLSYAAPEHIAGRPIGVSADVYALGVMLYELLSGTLPYTTSRNTSGALEDAILTGDAPAPSSRVDDARLSRQLRGDLDSIVCKAIKRDPKERYQTAEALAADIQRYLGGHAIEARPDSAWYRLRKAVMRHKVPVIGVSAVLAVALIGSTSTLLQGRKTAEEAERARLATAFVSELFRMNALNEGPMSDGAAQIGRAELVDRGAELIEARFQGQPTLQAELYGAVSRVYVDLGVDKRATEYATRQLASLRAQDADSSRIARSLMLLSEAALAADRNADAEDYARQAVALFATEDASAPDALALLARTQLLTGKLDEAKRTSAEGKRILGAQKRSKSTAGAWLQYVDGFVISREGRFDDAKRHYEAAIAEAIDAEGSTSFAATSVQLHLAHNLINNNRPEEGRQFARKAVAALERAGGMNRVRAAKERAYIQLRQLEMGSAGYEETIVVLEEVSAYLHSKSSAAPPEVVAEVNFMRARALMNYGEFEMAKDLANSSGAALLQSTQSLRKEWMVASILGACAMILGEHDTADKMLRRVIEGRRKMGAGNHPYASVDWAILAFNLSQQGRHEEAETLLSRTPKFGNIQGTSADYANVIPEALSRVRMDAADVRGAREVLPKTEKDPEYEDSNVVNSYYELRGEIRCASGDYTAGLFDLRRSINSQVIKTGPNHPWLARTRSIAGLCALSLGNRKLAEELAFEARRAFEAQPNVSPYFKEPLIRLEQKLRPSRATKS